MERRDCRLLKICLSEGAYLHCQIKISYNVFKYLRVTGTFQNNSDDRLKTLACHSSVEFGDKLSNLEMLRLIEDLSKCNEPWKCPHGRPVLIQISESELSKWFSRT